MKKNTASQIFGTFLPFPVIKSVTLEGGGSIIKSTNPHIVTPGDFDNNTESGGSENALKTKIIVALRDVMETSGLTAFFDEEKVLNIMNVVVLQSTDASKTATYKDNPQALYNMSVGNTPATESYKYFSAGSNPHKTKSTVINGEVILEKPYQFEFTLPVMQPRHLSYFCICTIDYTAFAAEFDLQPQEINGLYSGAYAKDMYESSHIVVIDGGATSYTEDTFYLPTGQKWEGPTHKDNGVFYTGNTHTNEPEIVLTKKMTSSQGVIKDFRGTAGAPVSKDSFYKAQSKLINFFGPPREEKLVNEIAETSREMLLYDLITYTPPIENQLGASKVGILLTLDYKKLTEQYARLSNVILKPKPKTVRLFRKNMLTSNPPAETPRLIGVYELDGIDSKRYVTWHFADTAPPGNYSYHVELELNIKEHIKYVEDSITTFKTLIRTLDRYYRIATKAFNKEGNSSLDKNVGSISHTEDFDLTKNKKIQMFDSNLGKYIPEFKKETEDIFKALKKQLNSAAAVNVTGDAYSYYTGGLSALLSVLDPTNGSPDGILAAKKIFADGLQDFEKIYGGKTVKTGYSQDHTQKYAVKAKNYEKIVIKLRSVLDLTNNIDFGYEYLPMPPDSLGAPSYSIDSFNQELIARMGKYFGTSGRFTDGVYISQSLTSLIGSFGNISDTMYQYIGTNKVYTGDIVLDSSDLNLDDESEEKQVASLLSILDYNILGPESKYTKPSILNSLSPLGIMPQFMADSLPNFSEYPTGYPTEVESNDTTDPDNYNGKLTHIGLNPSETGFLFSLMRNSDSKFSDMKDIRFYTLASTIPGESRTPPTGKNIYTSKATELGPPGNQWGNIILSMKNHAMIAASVPSNGSSRTGEQQIQKLLATMPNQIKALILSSTSEAIGASVSTTSINIGPFKEARDSKTPIEKNDPRKTLGAKFARHWFNFENIARIEFLSGFDTGPGNPRWETLKELPTPGSSSLPKHMLCRLVKYENKLFNIRRPKVLELPIYNEYFLIKL